MTKKAFVFLAAFFILTLPAFSAETAEPCKEQQLKIQALENEIQSLQQEVLELRQTLDRIRSQAGGNETVPTGYGSAGAQ